MIAGAATGASGQIFDDDTEEEDDEPSLFEQIFGADSDGPTEDKIRNVVGEMAGENLQYDEALEVLNAAVDNSSTSGNQTTRGASYILTTDGTTIDAYAAPQSSFDDLTDYSSIGTLLEEIIKNQLRPTGTDKEAEGRVYLTQGEYPGYLSDYSTATGTVLPMGLKLIGEGRMDPVEVSTTQGQIPNLQPLVTLYTQDDAFVQPDHDTDAVIGPEVHDLAILGPGVGTTGSTAFDGNNGTNRWDWMDIQNVSVWDFDIAHDFRQSHHVRLEYFHAQKFNSAYGSDPTGSDKFWLYDSQYFSVEQGSNVELGGKYVRVENTHFGTRSNSGSGNLHIPGGEQIVLDGCLYNTFGGSPAAGLYINGDPTSVVVIGNQTEPAGDFDDAYSVISGRVQFFGCVDLSNATNSFNFNGSANEGTEKADTRFCHAPNGINWNAFTLPMVEGTNFRGSAPSSSDFTASDAGMTIVDTSTSPPDQYMIDETGGVVGPF